MTKQDTSRLAAYRTLLRIEKDGAYSNLALNAQIQKDQPDSPGFTRELVYAVLRNKLYLDFLLSQMVSRGFRKLRPEPLTLLRMGMAQIIFMESVPDHAAVNETVRLARKYAQYQAGMINGVLRTYLRDPGALKQPETIADPAEAMSVRYSVDPSIVRLWTEQYGQERAGALLAAANTTPALTVRVNTMRAGREQLVEELERQGVRAEAKALSPRLLSLSGESALDTEAYRGGLFSPQGTGSVLAVDALAPLPGETVIDVCAAPGGKSLAAAEMMENTGRITAMDIYERKLNEVSRQAERLCVSIIETRVHDGTVPDPALKETADKVICDVPCSGLGVLRKKPEIKYRPLADQGRELAEIQKKILAAAATYVRPGGRLLYSTCTVNRHENQDVTEAFLKEHPEFQKTEQRQLMPDEPAEDGFYYCIMRKE